ncbi:TPA: YejG family protein [Escherichia coli]
MTSLQLSIVHRLPQNYRWSAGFAGSKVEPIPQNGPCGDNSLVALKLLSLVALKLLSPDGDNAWSVMYKLSQALSDIEVPCSVLECEGEPCLFVNRQDEFAATCRLKNFGVAIAEPFSNYNPF